MKSGYYLNSKGNLAIVYPDGIADVWVDETENVFFRPDNWLRFEIDNVYASVFEWEYLEEL